VHHLVRVVRRRLPAQHLVPPPSPDRHMIEEAVIALGRHLAKKRLHRGSHGSDNTKCRWRAASKGNRPFVDLNDNRSRLRQEFGIGVVRAKHQEEIALHDCVVDRARAVYAYAGAFQFAARMNSRNARSLPGISVRAG
jgi:hypothetical protein